MKTKKQSLHKFFLSIAAAIAIFTFAVPQTHAASIGSLLSGQICEPDNTPAGYSTNLARCINNVYTISLYVGGIFAVLMFIVAGYNYSMGDPKSVSTAKSIMSSTVAGLVILFGAYALLNTIDPEFTKIPTIQAPNVDCSGDKCDTTPTGDGTSPVTPPPNTGGGITPPGEHPDVPSSPNNVKEVADDILQNGNVVLARGHVSGVNDWANARQNIVDAANGKQASLSDYQNAPGGSVTLDVNMLKGLKAIGDAYRVNVSEIAGGSHSVGSRHYLGKAFDINIVNGVHLVKGRNGVADLAKKIMDMCKSYGATQVLDETSNNHVHCAW